MRSSAPLAFLAIPEAHAAASGRREESLAYTRWLATHHYENFHVVSFLLPKRLHQDFYNVYAFCRWADDLGDEIGDTAREPAPARLVARRAAGHVRRATRRHPVFVALRARCANHACRSSPSTI